MAEGLLVEIMPNGQPLEQGRQGIVLVTDVLNYAMPLIRYRIGDIASGEPAECKCGRGLPRLKGIIGRVTDFLVGSDGRIVSGAALTVAMVARRPSLGQVQIVQNQRGQVLFRIASPKGTESSKADLLFLRSEAEGYLGSPVSVDFEFVDQILPEPSGKMLFSKSSVPTFV